MNEIIAEEEARAKEEADKKKKELMKNDFEINEYIPEMAKDSSDNEFLSEKLDVKLKMIHLKQSNQKLLFQIKEQIPQNSSISQLEYIHEEQLSNNDSNNFDDVSNLNINESRPRSAKREKTLIITKAEGQEEIKKFV